MKNKCLIIALSIIFLFNNVSFSADNLRQMSLLERKGRTQDARETETLQVKQDRITALKEVLKGLCGIPGCLGVSTEDKEGTIKYTFLWVDPRNPDYNEKISFYIFPRKTDIWVKAFLGSEGYQGEKETFTITKEDAHVILGLDPVYFWNSEKEEWTWRIQIIVPDSEYDEILSNAQLPRGVSQHYDNALLFGYPHVFGVIKESETKRQGIITETSKGTTVALEPLIMNNIFFGVYNHFKRLHVGRDESGQEVYIFPGITIDLKRARKAFPEIVKILDRHRLSQKKAEALFIKFIHAHELGHAFYHAAPLLLSPLYVNINEPEDREKFATVFAKKALGISLTADEKRFVTDKIEPCIYKELLEETTKEKFQRDLLRKLFIRGPLTYDSQDPEENLLVMFKRSGVDYHEIQTADLSSPRITQYLEQEIRDGRLLAFRVSEIDQQDLLAIKIATIAQNDQSLIEEVIEPTGRLNATGRAQVNQIKQLLNDAGLLNERDEWDPVLTKAISHCWEALNLAVIRGEGTKPPETERVYEDGKWKDIEVKSGKRYRYEHVVTANEVAGEIAQIPGVTTTLLEELIEKIIGGDRGPLPGFKRQIMDKVGVYRPKFQLNILLMAKEIVAENPPRPRAPAELSLQEQVTELHEELRELRKAMLTRDLLAGI